MSKEGGSMRFGKRFESRQEMISRLEMEVLVEPVKRLD